jgi:hypothetical protein
MHDSFVTPDNKTRLMVSYGREMINTNLMKKITLASFILEDQTTSL